MYTQGLYSQASLGPGSGRYNQDCENTEGLYHSLLRGWSRGTLGKKDEPIVIEEFPGLEGEVGTRAPYQGVEESN